MKRKLSSFQIIILCFAGVILTGALLLMLPISSKAGVWTSFEDSLFTSTSAVCVTGLIVQDTASYWSIFGQVIILLLIQTGGLGVISIAAFITNLKGGHLSFFGRSMLADTISSDKVGGVIKLTKFFFRGVFIIELVGALLLMPVFCTDFGFEGIWLSIFHSISAFCNAGFDILGDKAGAFTNLTSYAGSIVVTFVISFLIIIGGLGFITWGDITQHKFRFKKYKMQSKVILVTTALLIIIPTIIFFFTEYSGYGFKERFLMSFFQAVTPRTAGFNTSDLSAMTSAGRTIMIILMLIGGSPGSTAGGMKTTTFTVLMANAFSIFKRNKNTNLFKRRIDDSVIKSASTLLLMYVSLTLISAMIISLIEGFDVGTCLYETASAMATVGLTLGITTKLSAFSHYLLVVLMFIGRVGGFTLIFAAMKKKGGELSKLPTENINVG